MKAKKFRVQMSCVSGYYKGHDILQDVESNSESAAGQKALRYMKNSAEPNFNLGKYKVKKVKEVKGK